jgi:hypothetical protein
MFYRVNAPDNDTALPNMTNLKGLTVSLSKNMRGKKTKRR